LISVMVGVVILAILGLIIAAIFKNHDQGRQARAARSDADQQSLNLVHQIERQYKVRSNAAGAVTFACAASLGGVCVDIKVDNANPPNTKREYRFETGCDPITANTAIYNAGNQLSQAAKALCGFKCPNDKRPTIHSTLWPVVGGAPNPVTMVPQLNGVKRETALGAFVCPNGGDARSSNVTVGFVFLNEAGAVGVSRRDLSLMLQDNPDDISWEH
jgi:Tfp pilus assembly protein PilE